MLVPAFQLNLGQPIVEGHAAIGLYDGRHPCLTCATNAGKIFVHSPHTRIGDNNEEMRFLNLNKRVTALAAGPVNPNSEYDLLLIGTSTNLVAYDVEKNADIFFKDVPDGVNSMKIGKFAQMTHPHAIIGGNCSVQAFDHEGNEQFWTVTGDNVSAMALCDVNEDGKNELLVGSDDFEIRVFQNEEYILETTETDRVTHLCPILGSRFGYGLGNGTVGVYNQDSRVWRVKSKHQVTSLAGYDFDSDGVPEVIAGLSSGKLEIRNSANGELVYKDHIPSPVSALLSADYRLDGQEELVCCSVDGTVRGYLPASDEQAAMLDESKGGTDELLRELGDKKQELLFELNSYEENLKQLKLGATQSASQLPAGTGISTRLEPNAANKCVDLVVETNNDDAFIKCVIVFAENVFDGESHVTMAPPLSTTCRVPLAPAKDIHTELHIKALVGTASSAMYHTFETDVNFPKFAMYVCSEANTPDPESRVRFEVNDRLNRLVMWMNGAFNFHYQTRGNEKSIVIKFKFLRDSQAPLHIRIRVKGVCEVEILTADMEVAGEIVQDLCAFLDISELQSEADFPAEMESFRDVLLKVDEYNAVRLKLTADMADATNLVKQLVIKAEDARLLGDMKLMKKVYNQLFEMNGELIGEHIKRTQNHQALLSSLKDVNQMIQKAARLRVGSAKSRVVSSCRNAIKANNIQSLFKIIKMGDAAV